MLKPDLTEIGSASGSWLESEDDDDLLRIPSTNPKKSCRPRCASCLRPLNVCYCDTLPKQKLDLKRDLPAVNSIVIFQHPKEATQAFASVRPLQLCCTPNSVLVLRTRRPSEVLVQAQVR